MEELVEKIQDSYMSTKLKFGIIQIASVFVYLFASYNLFNIYIALAYLGVSIISLFYLYRNYYDVYFYYLKQIRDKHSIKILQQLESFSYAQPKEKIKEELEELEESTEKLTEENQEVILTKKQQKKIDKKHFKLGNKSLVHTFWFNVVFHFIFLGYLIFIIVF